MEVLLSRFVPIKIENTAVWKRPGLFQAQPQIIPLTIIFPIMKNAILIRLISAVTLTNPFVFQ